MQPAYLVGRQMLVLEHRRVDVVATEVEAGDLVADLRVELRAWVRRHEVEIGKRRVQPISIAPYGVNLLAGIVRKAEHESGHGANAQSSA